jgi:hypothetical protein
MAETNLAQAETNALIAMQKQLLNDAEHAVSFSVVNALKSYEVHPVPWSQRGQVQKVLVA